MVARSVYVYVMSGLTMSKIGIAADVRKRFRELKRDGARTIVKTWHRPDDARKVEHAAKALLRSARTTYRTEWFSVPAERAIEVVREAIALVEAGLPGPAAPRKRTKLVDAEKMRRLIEEYDNTIYTYFPRTVLQGLRANKS